MNAPAAIRSPLRDGARLWWSVCSVAVVVLANNALAEDAVGAFQARIQPLLKTYCADCHGGEKPKAKIDLSGARTREQLFAERDLWLRVLEQIEGGKMPPKDEAQLRAQDRDTLATWLRTDFTNLHLARQRAEGRSRLRRLSRAEYANTIEDLLGVRPPVTKYLPTDGRVDGYDKIGSALPLSADGAAGYLKLADVILQGLFQSQPKMSFNDAVKPVAKDSPFDPKRSYRVRAEESEQSKGHILELPDGITKVSFNTDNTSGPLYQLPLARVPGFHRLRMSVYGYQTDKPLPFGIYAGNTKAYPQTVELRGVLEAPPGKPAIIEASIYLSNAALNDIQPYGDGFRLVPFGLGVPVPKNSQASQCRGPGLAVQWVEVEEPSTPLPGDYVLRSDFAKISSSNRETLLKTVEATVARVGARFFRRDLTRDEIAAYTQRFAAQYDAKVPASEALRDVFVDLLTAPDFLCLIETPGKLNDFALASRLSYFLWNSAPDDELLDLARQGRLRDSKTIAAQTDRMLKDKRSMRFIESFTDQWLNLRAIDDTSPDSKLYPEYAENDLLKRSSLFETRAFFARMLQQNLSVREFVAADWTFMNEALAKHYGVREISGVRLQRVNLPAGSPYGGLWTQPSVLKVTANGTFTSPVKRGVWVAERLLGTPIPPPPPDIPAVEPDTRGAKTLREQLALHREKGSCAACHAKFDPYGFALESFDPMGASRSNYRILNPAAEAQTGRYAAAWMPGPLVDSSGETPDGQRFADIRELRRILADRPERLARGVTRHLVTYATGAPVTRLDQPAIDAIVEGAAKDGYGLRSLINGVVQSELFRWK
jgi:mono/diheme cytochrome c family protein